MLSEPMRHKSATPPRIVIRKHAVIRKHVVLRKHAGMAATVGVIAALAASFSATRAVEAAAPANCIAQLTSGSGPELICSYPTQLGEKERTELRRMTGDLFTDARCLVNIRIERRQITTALVKPDYVFQATPQAVTCEVIGKDEKLPIAATFAPRIVLKGGRAVDAHPGMANLTGLNEVLADPLLQYINQSDAIRAQMVRVANLYIANKQIGPQAFKDRG
jgi:hypothetical protein